MRRDSVRERSARRAVAVAILALLVVVAGLWYLSGRREARIAEAPEVDLDAVAQDVEQASESVAQDLDQAVGALRRESRDAVITAKVKTALALSKSVSAFDIDVDTDSERVTLSGSVPTAEAERSALQIARDTSGVGQVVDNLEVGPVSSDQGQLVDRIADAELKALVYESLLDDEGIDGRRIRVLVENRAVTLTGSVPSPLEKDRAERIVRGIAGVESVESHLEVAIGPNPS